MNSARRPAARPTTPQSGRSDPIRHIAKRLDEVEAAAHAASASQEDARADVGRVHSELKSTTGFLIRELEPVKELVRESRQKLFGLETQLAELHVAGARKPALTIEGGREGPLLEMLKPLVYAIVAETMERQGDVFAAAIEQVGGEARKLAEHCEAAELRSSQEVKELRRQLEASEKLARGARETADGVLQAAEGTARDVAELQAAVQQLADAPAAPAPAPARGGTVHQEMGRLLEKRLDGIQRDMESGTQRLAELDVKCVAAIDSSNRSRKACRKFESQLAGAQERLDTRLDRLLAQAMQRPPPPDVHESVPPSGAGEKGAADAMALMTPISGGGTATATGWEEHASVDGTVYYYNASTRQSTWTRPTAVTTPPKPRTSAPSQVAQVAGGEGARVVALEQAVAEERNQRLLFEEAVHVKLKSFSRSLAKQGRRYEKAEARLRSAGKDGKSKAKGGSEAGSGGEEVQADGAPAPQSAMGNLVFETKTKVEQLEKALETLDRRSTLSRPSVSDDDEEEDREGDEALSGGRRGGGATDVKALGARLSKLEKSVRSQATASMRE